MPYSTTIIRLLDRVEPPIKEVLLAILEEIERQRKQWEESVTKTEFNELKEIVAELAKKVDELAEAQKKTEQKIKELVEAQKRTEQRVDKLEVAVRELAEAQKKTEQRVNELAEAQKKTEEQINRLVKRMDVFEDRLEGISNSVGYSLENRTYKGLPEILFQRFGIKVRGRLLRRYFPIGNKNIQLNIYGYGSRDGEDVVIIGECKVRPSKREISRFKKYAQKVAEIEGKNPFYIIVAHDFPPAIEDFLRSNNIPYVWSYELE